MNKRVVITGIGALTSLGSGRAPFWQAIRSGQNGISRIERVDTSDLEVKVGAEIKDFDPGQYLDKKEVRRTDRYAQFALAAAQMAIADARIDFDREDRDRLGIILGTGIGGMETLEGQHSVLLDKGADRVSPFCIPMMIPNMAAGMVAIRHGLKGFVETVITACASSTNSVGDAFRLIRSGEAEVLLAGGTEAPITRLALAGFCASKALSPHADPGNACRPFDLDRNGFVMGEGAGILVLEELEHALARGASIVAEVVGYGSTNDAYHITASPDDAEGGVRCMRQALADAQVQPGEIGYINAHGTSTPLNDRNETTAVRQVFGPVGVCPPISSTKSMTGHLLGASGAIETIITALALQDQYLPPTINYRTPDPLCDLDYVPNTGRAAAFDCAISNSFGFGGHNATLVLRAYR